MYSIILVSVACVTQIKKPVQAHSFGKQQATNFVLHKCFLPLSTTHSREIVYFYPTTEETEVTLLIKHMQV